MLELTILDCGTTLDDVYNKYGHATDWIQNKLSEHEINYKIFKVYNDDFPPITKNSPYIITGSADSVYDNKEWMLRLESFIVTCREKKCFLLGICFGHQIIAKAFGGKVIKNPLGWELGSNILSLTEKGLQSNLFKHCEKSFSVYESHQDIVSLLPYEAEALAYNDMGNQSFSIDERIFAVQFHPEFNREISQQYLDVRLGLGATSPNRVVEDSSHSNIIINNFYQLYRKEMHK